MSEERETHEFSADITQLLGIIINTFYSNNDVFLRELISNANDALDKVRQKTLVEKDYMDGYEELSVKLSTDMKNNLLVVEDTGIGMSKEELVTNLGTIAKSGTKAFIESLKDTKNSNLIGQFGVGFYASYLVANKVVVHSRAKGSEQYVWESKADGSYTVYKDSQSDIVRGTRIVLHMKDNATEYLQAHKLKNLVNVHSKFIRYPIQLLVEKTVQREVTDDEEEEEDDDDEGVVKEVSSEEKKKKTVTEVEQNWDLLNEEKPLWTRNPSEVTEEEYGNFYKSLTGDFDPHMQVKHFSAEGQIEYKALLYVPDRMPYDMFNNNKNKKNIKLFVRRVFITDECSELLPEWLSFVKGVVDSYDLPLNISREVLQQNKIIRVISKNLVKKCIDMFNTIAEDEERYMNFYMKYSKNIKWGMHHDGQNREKILPLVRYFSSQSKDKLTSLENYVDNMKEDQKGIYYITGENLYNIDTSPHLEMLNKKGYDVLYMNDPIDEYCMQVVTEFKGKKFISVTEHDFSLEKTESEQKTLDTYSDDYKPLCKVMSELLNHGVEKVIVSDRLVYAPCVLVAGQKGLSANMERILKAQAIRNPVSRETILSKRIMELNPKHPMVKSLNNLCHTLDMGQVLNERTEKLEKEKEMKKEGVDESIDTSEEDDNENEEVIAKNMEIKRFEDITWLLYDMALIDSGFSLEQPRHFTSRIQNILSSVMGYNMTPSFFEEGSESKKENMKTSKSMETTKQMATIQEDNENVDVELDTDNLQNIELEVN